MSQTFYIDADEEVNSVISKLRKTPSKRNILVVAQRALILQSSVSLRLIKNEMDNLSKKVMIITQDEQGLAMAKKIGFATRKSMEGIKSKEQIADNREPAISFAEKNKQIMQKNEATPEIDVNKHNRLKNLGVKEFASVSGVMKRTSPEKQSRDFTREETSRENSFEINKNNIIKNDDNTINDKNNIEEALKLKEEKETDFNDLFVDPKKDELIEKNKKENNITVGRSRKLLWLFGLAVLVLLVGISAYLLFPKATVTIIPREIEKNVNLTVRAIDNITGDKDETDDTITLVSKLVEDEETLSLTFKATGDKTSSNQKARGKITIYNNFSEASQILVATTRFLTEDGKLFRLTKTVTVPGMIVENGEKKAGKIEAGVIADKAGEEYNIESATFSIPGFKGSSKYDKFYAKSNQQMKGGGADDSELKTVSKSDIEKAKKESEEKLKKQIVSKMREEIGDNNTLLDGAIKFEILDMAVFPEEGAVTDNFEYQLKIKGTGIYFATEDLDNKIKDYINKNVAPQDYQIEVVSVEKKYDNPEVNFDDKTLDVHLKLEILLRAKIDNDKIKQELAGKGQRQIDAFVSRHPEIQKLEAEISPSIFASKLPKYANRITVHIAGN